MLRKLSKDFINVRVGMVFTKMTVGHKFCGVQHGKVLITHTDTSVSMWSWSLVVIGAKSLCSQMPFLYPTRWVTHYSSSW